MPSAILERLEAQRAEQLAFMDMIFAQAEQDGQRDLVPAEQANLQSARERIAQIDAQLGPVREFESLREASAEGSPFVPSRQPGRPDAQPLGQPTAGAFPYRTAGAYLVDLLRSRGFPRGSQPDTAAATRIQRAALDNQTTTDTPGILPTPIIGPIINTLDASRPFITSIGAKSLAGVPGTSFSRPRVTQHVQVGKQTAEKTELASRRMTITPVPFNKETYGGAVDISRQDIDWTSPSAWDALVQDLADVYGGQTELVASTAFAAAITQSETAAANDLEGITAALYAAAVKCYRGGAAAGAMPTGKLPDRLWVSLDMWATIGALVDTARLVVRSGTGNLGDSSLASFAGDVLDVPRIVVPTLPDGTAILGSASLTEFYEDQIGLLSAIEPSILGVEVGYGGYVAYGTLEPAAFCKVALAPVIP